MNRRDSLKSGIMGAGAFLFGTSTTLAVDNSSFKLKNNINHSVCQWTYNHLSLEALCILVKKIGFSAIDLVGPKDWPILKKYGIISSMCNGAEISLTKGWNDAQYHQVLIDTYSNHIGLVAKAGFKNLICFSGNRNGMSDEEGLNHCVNGLKKIMAFAEKNGVIIQMELFNSKIDHKDYMCDNTDWGIELCERIGSPNFKLLYDIYHMQINEGDIIRTIKEKNIYFGHYHTAGVPGRHEIDNSQELNYPAIMQAIADTGFGGYVAQEFIPTGKTTAAKEKALRNAIRVCDI